jgi:uncharacterized protein
MTTNPQYDQSGRPVAPSRSRLRPLGLHEVRITGGFWAERQTVNASATLEHCLDWMERVGWIDNFRAVTSGQLSRDSRQGREFSDSEIYKLSEGLAWEVGRTDDSRVGSWLDDLVKVIAAAQRPDGYLNTAFGHPGQPARYTDLEWGHELYCYGFLLQAAIARARVGGEDEFTAVARRAADHVCDTFGPGGIDGLCGHAEIEMALVELARLTGEQRYLDQAALFVERRGHQKLADIAFGRPYFQDDVPVREATVLRGHAVRALYLAAGAVDVAVEIGDDDLLAAVIGQWEAGVARRTYITGGMGAHHEGEAFGDDFVLPPDRAYSETCASIASVMLSWRLLLATGEPRFADLAERTLLNVVATSPAADGRAFFYANTLHQRRRGILPATDVPSPRAQSSLRAPWFAVSCCPTNISRTLACLAAYFATADERGLQIHQYADADIATSLAAGREVGVAVRTDYPATGTITCRITRSDTNQARPWTLTLRVPAWAGSAELVEPDGKRQRVGVGTATVTRAFAVGDEVRLELPMTPRWVVADPRVDAVRGTRAVERGPVVMCVESVDLPDDLDVDAVRLDPSVPPADHDGTVSVAGTLQRSKDDRPWPFRDVAAEDEEPHGPALGDGHERSAIEIPLVPYHSWARRGPSTMRVWMPVAER